MTRVLSSAATSYWRYIFPVLWIGGMGAATLAIWSGAFHGRKDEPTPEFMYWLFPVGWILGSVSIVLFVRRLCHVVLRDDAVLEVSRFGRAPEQIPLSSVVDVSQSSLLSNLPTITLHLEPTSGHQRRIVFLPFGRRPIFSEYALTGELRALASRARPPTLPSA